MEIVHYKPFKVTIDISGLTKIIINVMMQHYGFPTPALITAERFFPLNSGFGSAISLTSCDDFLLLFTVKQTNKQYDKIA